MSCIELSHRGARASGVCTGICIWAVTHMGILGGVGGDRIGNILLNYIDTAL